VKTATASLNARIACWIGAGLDALAFLQMALPGLGRAMLGVRAPITAEYVFAIELGAGLMLAWTILLVWTQRKPLERWALLPMTMLIIAWNLASLWKGMAAGILPASSAAPQFILAGALFAYLGFCSLAILSARRSDAEDSRSRQGAA
jgi:hypothetical protein